MSEKETAGNCAQSKQLRVECALGTWMPIDTMPTDGTPVLVLLPEVDTINNSRVQVAAKWSNGYFIIGHQFAFDSKPPTYWMPLPAPPEST